MESIVVKKEDRYDSLIWYYADQNNLDWLRIKAQIKQESAFNPMAMNARSHCKGLGQFADATWLEYRRDQEADVYNPEDNIDAMCRYMRWLLRQVNQDYPMALAAYNWGIGNVKKLIATPELTTVWISHLPDETAGYIRKINEYWNDYQHELLKRNGRTGQT